MQRDGKVKVLQLSDWDFTPIDEYNASGGSACDCARYGVEHLRESKRISVNVFWPDDGKKITRFLTKVLKLEGRNVILQLKAIKESKNYDVIYAPADRHLILISIARKLGICKAPILMVCHFTFNRRYVESWKKRALLSFERKLVYSSIDRILFACDRVLELACEDAKVPIRHRNTCHWGASIEYFGNFEKNENGNYYLSAGNANRDYKTLIDAFRKMSCNVIVCCPKTVAVKFGDVPDNILFYDIADSGVDHYRILRNLYGNCKAVLIPIDHTNHVPNGATVFAEGIAAGKPIIITDLPTNFLDVEKEGIGIKTKLHDSASWISAIQQLENSPQDSLLMGKHALDYAKQHQNYGMFCETVEKELLDLAEHRD